MINWADEDATPRLLAATVATGVKVSEICHSTYTQHLTQKLLPASHPKSAYPLIPTEKLHVLPNN